jgi:hypothetical protein
MEMQPHVCVTFLHVSWFFILFLPSMCVSFLYANGKTRNLMWMVFFIFHKSKTLKFMSSIRLYLSCFLGRDESSSAILFDKV